jgi:hypothetical protein
MMLCQVTTSGGKFRDRRRLAPPGGGHVAQHLLLSRDLLDDDAPAVKIALERLVADGFQLELPRSDGRVDRVVLARAVALRGGYAQDLDWITLDAIAADEVHGQATWHWPGGSLRAGPATALRHPEVALRVALGELNGRARLTGRIAARSVEAPELALDIGATGVRAAVSLSAVVFHQPSTKAQLEASALMARAVAAALPDGELSVEGIAATALHLEWTESGALRATATRLEARGVAVRVGTSRLTVAALIADRVHVARDDSGALRVEVGELSVEGMDLASGDAALRIDHGHLPAGLAWSGRELTVRELTIDRATLRAVIPKRTGPSTSTTTSSRSGRSIGDLRFLDHLDGRLDVDLTVDAKVPFIRRRVATHEFRIPIRSGRLDYRRLESDLSFIEDALIDFAVRDGQLVLETNLPLSPFRGHPIATWPLDGDELLLARDEQRVLLSTLSNPQLPVRTRNRFLAEMSTFELTRLDFDKLVLDVRLGGPAQLSLGDAGTVRFGAADRPALGQLIIEGGLQFRPDGGTKPTELRLSATDARLGLDRMALGETMLDIPELEVGAIESAVVQFHGFSPTEATATLRSVAVRRLSLTPPSRAR